MKKRNYYCLISIILLVILVTLFIPTGDDWAWGTTIGVQRLLDLFKNYNGRYAGNILILLLTRSNIFRIIFMSTTFISIIYILNKYINKNIKYYILISTMFLLMPKEIFAETIVWSSGFVNYTISLLIILFSFYFVNKNIKTDKMYNFIVVFILGFLGNLFMENYTIYQVFLSLFFLLYYSIKNKKINKLCLIYFIGNLCGALLMFTNGAYMNVVNATDTYRSINVSISSRILDGIIPKLNNYTFINILILLSFYKIYKMDNRKSIKLFLLLLFIEPAYNIIILLNPNLKILLSYTKYLDFLIYLTFIISMLYLTINLKDKKLKYNLLFYFISIIILCGPLLFVNPIGARNFLIIYVLEILFSITLFSKSYNVNNFKVLEKFNIFYLIIYIGIYGYIYYFNMKELDHIRTSTKNNEQCVEVRKNYYKGYLWSYDVLDNPEFLHRYKKFYKIDSDIIITYEKCTDKK